MEFRDLLKDVSIRTFQECNIVNILSSDENHPERLLYYSSFNGAYELLMYNLQPTLEELSGV